jgi:hypothetical protein
MIMLGERPARPSAVKARSPEPPMEEQFPFWQGRAARPPE